ncbi:MAG: hypothetical protein RR161_00805 [Bacilli bacterium]
MFKFKDTKYDIGKTYLFKEGEVTVLDLTITESSLKIISDDLKLNFDYNINSDEERQLSFINDDYNVDVDKMYQEYINAGFSVIRDGILIRKTEEGNITADKRRSLSCVVAQFITSKDAINIRTKFKELEASSSKDFIKLKNYLQNENGFTIDNYDLRQNNHVLTSMILDYYLKEKLGQLTKEEQEMFDKYRNFDLTEVLTVDNKSKYPVNNTNAGVMVITKEKTFESTVKGMQHALEFDVVFQNMKSDIDSSKMDIPAMVYNSSDVLVQVSLGFLIIWQPDNMNEYQVETVRNIAKIVNNINKNVSKDKQIGLYSSEISGPTFESTFDVGKNYTQLISYLDENYSKQVEKCCK